MKPKHHISISAIVATIVLLTPTAATAEPSAYKGLVMPREWYINLAICETGKNPNHNTRSYTSQFGIARGVWQKWSNSSSAKGKTPRQQAMVADNIAFEGHTEDDGTFIPPVGVWGWGAVKNNCNNLQSYICKSKKPIVRKWRRNCG